MSESIRAARSPSRSPAPARGRFDVPRRTRTRHSSQGCGPLSAATPSAPRRERPQIGVRALPPTALSASSIPFLDHASNEWDTVDNRQNGLGLAGKPIQLRGCWRVIGRPTLATRQARERCDQLHRRLETVLTETRRLLAESADLGGELANAYGRGCRTSAAAVERPVADATTRGSGRGRARVRAAAGDPRSGPNRRSARSSPRS